MFIACYGDDFHTFRAVGDSREGAIRALQALWLRYKRENPQRAVFYPTDNAVTVFQVYPGDGFVDDTFYGGK